MRTLSAYAEIVNEALNALPHEDTPPLLRDAMRYSLLAGGKRLRPAMLLAAVEMLGGDLDEALPMACAVEMIHTYSLIHDDLPGMDDDTLRRGRPTNHVVYGVGQAILAGDGLLSEAFETMLQNALVYPQNTDKHLRAIYEIARGAGARGMVAGQCVDLDCERKQLGSPALLEVIQRDKTCRMFVHPLRAAAILSGAGGEKVAALGDYGYAFGRLFQTVDDLLDVTGDPALLGKSVGKDEQSGKLTAVAQYGLDGARQRCGEYVADGLRALRPFGEDGAFFAALLRETAHRVR